MQHWITPPCFPSKWKNSSLRFILLTIKISCSPTYSNFFGYNVWWNEFPCVHTKHEAIFLSVAWLYTKSIRSVFTRVENIQLWAKKLGTSQSFAESCVGRTEASGGAELNCWEPGSSGGESRGQRSAFWRNKKQKQIAVYQQKRSSELTFVNIWGKKVYLSSF